MILTYSARLTLGAAVASAAFAGVSVLAAPGHGGVVPDRGVGPPLPPPPPPAPPPAPPAPPIPATYTLYFESGRAKTDLQGRGNLEMAQADVLAVAASNARSRARLDIYRAGLGSPADRFRPGPGYFYQPRITVTGYTDAYEAAGHDRRLARERAQAAAAALEQAGAKPAWVTILAKGAAGPAVRGPGGHQLANRLATIAIEYTTLP